MGDLLAFNCLGVIGSEDEVDDGHIVDLDVEVSESAFQSVPDLTGDLVSVGEQLVGVVMGNHRLQDFVDDGWHDSLVIVGSEISVDGLESLCVWSVEDSESNLDLLEVVGPSDTVDLSGLVFDIENDWSLEPWSLQMPSFLEGLFAHSVNTVELEGHVSWLHLVNARFSE